MYDRKVLKREARTLMHAARPHYMLVALVYVLLTTGLSWVVSALTGLGGVMAGTLSVFLEILVALFAIVMGMGLCSYALRLSRGEPTAVGDLFDGFAFAGRSIGMRLLIVLYSFLWMLLATAGFAVVLTVAVLLMEHVAAVGVILFVLAYIALIAAAFAILLRYAMAEFALVENPDGGVSAAIRCSVQLMRGNRWKLFVMELSFLGWNLLVLLIAGVVTGVGFVVSGTGWMVEGLLSGGDPWEIYDLTVGLIGQLNLWTVLGEIVSLPLSLWLVVYMQTSFARFYNYVSGYDRPAPGGEQPVQAIPLTPAAPESSAQPEQPEKAAPPAPPAGGYYTPAPDLDAPQDGEQPDEEE